jgi:type I restriction enzyme M protein
VILTNPPFGGKEGQHPGNYAFETSATQVLFLQHILGRAGRAGAGGDREGGRCGVVLDEGLLFRTNESAFVETKRKLLDECELWCIVSLPGGVFSTAGAGVKTNLLFFTKGRKTERIWYYDLSQVKMGKKTPMTLAHFGWGNDFRLLDDAELPARSPRPSKSTRWSSSAARPARARPRSCRRSAWNSAAARAA